LGLGTFSCSIYGYIHERRNHILRERNYADQMDNYNAAKEKFMPYAISSDKKYDFGIINHFLQLTPKQILDN